MSITDNRLHPCTCCRGRGWVRSEDILTQHGMWLPGGSRVPCPRCRGAKIEPADGDALRFRPDSGKGESDAKQG